MKWYPYSNKKTLAPNRPHIVPHGTKNGGSSKMHIRIPLAKGIKSLTMGIWLQALTLFYSLKEDLSAV
jgi:hypothetical protein